MDIIKEAFVVFMTTEQDIPVNDETNSYDWLEWILDSINGQEDTAAIYTPDESQISLYMDDVHCLSVQVDFNDNSFYCTLPENISDEEFDEFKNKKETAELAMLLFSFMNLWEYEVLPSRNGIQYSRITINLTDTEVELSTKEVEVLEGILKRMAEDKGYEYDKIEAKNFEIELRGLVEPLEKEQTIDNEEESSDDEWI